TTAEPIEVGPTGGGGGRITSISGTNTFTGPITLSSGADFRGSNLVFQGGITSTGDQGLGFNGSNYVVDTNPIDLDFDDTTAAGSMGFTSAGNNAANATLINVAGNDWGITTINFGGYVKIGGTDFLPNDTDVRFGWNWWSRSSGTLDLNGNDQTLGSLGFNGNSNGLGGDCKVTGLDGDVLTIDLESGSVEFQGRLEGGLSVVKEGAGTQILNNLSSATAPAVNSDPSPGPVIPSSYTGTTTINSGFLEIREDNALGATGFLRIDIDGTGNNLINGSFEDFTVDVGVADAGAKVTGSNTSFDLGEDNEYTITGWAPFFEDPNDVVGRYGNSGTTTDNSFYLDTASNVTPGAGSYDGVRGLLLNSVDGYRNGMINEDILTDLAVDPGLLNAGVEFRISVDLIRRDLINLGGDATGTATFMLTDSDGTTADRTDPANAIRSGTVDIDTLDGLNSNAFVFSLTGDELAAATELNLVIESVNTKAIVPPEVESCCGNDPGDPNEPGLDFANVSQIVFDNIVITARDSVSSAAAGTIVNGDGGNNDGLRIAGGATTDEPITIGATAGPGSISSGAGGGTLTGPITLEDGASDFRGGGNRLTFSGGISSVANQGLSLNLAATVDTNPIDLNNGVLTITSNGNNPATGTELNVGGNDWGLMRINFSGYLTLGGTDFLPADAGIDLGWSRWGFSPGTLDLNGFDQTVAFVAQASNSLGLGGNTVITDSTGSGSLTVDLDAGSKEYQGRFEGGVALVKNGAGTQILNNKSSTTAPAVATDPSPGPVIASTNTGATTVNGGILQIGDGVCTTATLSIDSAITINAAGTLCFNRPDTVTQGVDFSGAAISGAGTFEVKGGGTVVLTNDATFDDGATVSVTSGSTLELNYAGTDTIDRLFLDGVQVEAGTYDMSDPSGLLTGSGSLNVISGPPASSVPNIVDIAVDGSGNVTLTLDGSEAGLTVQQSDDLTDGSFTDIPATAGPNTFTIDAADADPNADGDDYYRVRN
ncbi:MAG: hypothetical protein HKO57_07845, partial [Akkermansiaceae bacterium]|nr:hypothetical protein [Akkermansiaceae bacterium]